MLVKVCKACCRHVRRQGEKRHGRQAGRAAVCVMCAQRRGSLFRCVRGKTGKKEKGVCGARMNNQLFTTDAGE